MKYIRDLFYVDDDKPVANFVYTDDNGVINFFDNRYMERDDKNFEDLFLEILFSFTREEKIDFKHAIFKISEKSKRSNANYAVVINDWIYPFYRGSVKGDTPIMFNEIGVAFNKDARNYFCRIPYIKEDVDKYSEEYGIQVFYL